MSSLRVLWTPKSLSVPRFNDPRDDMEAQMATGDPESDEEATTLDLVTIFLRKVVATNVEPGTWQKRVVGGQVSSRDRVQKSEVKMNL